MKKDKRPIPFDSGPCSGKSSGMARISERLSDAGYTPFVVPESATIVINMGVSPTSPDFQDYLLQEGLLHENIVSSYIAKNNIENAITLCDRALPSGKAYMQKASDFDRLIRNHGFKNYGELLARYDDLIFPVSVAVDKPEAYTTENNTARKEDVAEARLMNQKQYDIWIGHSKIRTVDNSTDFEGKKDRMFTEVCSTKCLPEPLNFEKKFLLKSFSAKDIPKNFTYRIVNIEQFYLNEADYRIRKRTSYGYSIYYHTYKKWLPNSENVRLDKIISAKEYGLYTNQTSTLHRPIYKKRYCFMYKNQYIEIDCFLDDKKEFMNILEIKPTNKQEQIILPEFLNIEKDVSTDPNYRTETISRALAKGSLSF